MSRRCGVCEQLIGHAYWCWATYTPDPELCGCGGSDGNHVWYCEKA